MYPWHNRSCSDHHWRCHRMVLPSVSLFLYSNLVLYPGGVGAQTLGTKHDWMLCHARLYHSWQTVPVHWTLPIPHATNHFHYPVPLLELAGISNANACFADTACKKQLVSILNNSVRMNSSQITTRTGTWSTSSLWASPISVHNAVSVMHFGKQTYQTVNAHTLTSLISLAYSTCHRGAQLINTTSKNASSLIDSTWCSNTTSSVLQ